MESNLKALPYNRSITHHTKQEDTVQLQIDTRRKLGEKSNIDWVIDGRKDSLFTFLRVIIASQ